MRAATTQRPRVVAATAAMTLESGHEEHEGMTTDTDGLFRIASTMGTP